MDRFNPENWHRLISEQRYQMMPPESILDALPLRADAVIGDIGCGPGFFTLPLAARLPQGLVHAIDVEPQMLQLVTERAHAAGLTNIQTLLVAESAIPLPAASLDGALLALVYHELPDRLAYLAMLGDLLRPQSWLALLDWDRKPNSFGGPALESRIPLAEASAELAAAGWRVVAQPPVNDAMYLLVAERLQANAD